MTVVGVVALALAKYVKFTSRFHTPYKVVLPVMVMVPPSEINPVVVLSSVLHPAKVHPYVDDTGMFDIVDSLFNVMSTEGLSSSITT